MRLSQSSIIGVTVSAAIFLLGSQSLAEGCVSATLADEVYYSCSGVLTVIPTETGENVNSSREGDLQRIEAKSDRRGGKPAESEGRSVIRNP